MSSVAPLVVPDEPALSFRSDCPEPVDRAGACFGLASSVTAIELVAHPISVDGSVTRYQP